MANNIISRNPITEVFNNSNPFSPFVSRAEELLKEYTSKFIKNESALTRAQIKSLDRIDIRPMLDIGIEDIKGHDIPAFSIERLRLSLDSESEDFRNFRENNGIYQVIPCYQKGVLQVASGRYIYWELLSVDVANEKVKMFIKDYIAYKNVWMPSVEGTIEYDSNNSYVTHSYTTIREMLGKIPLNNFMWSKDDRDVWKKMLREEERKENAFRKTFSTSSFDYLVVVFTMCILMVNYKLLLKKPVADRKSNRKVKEAVYIETDQPKKLIRTIGDVNFTSVKPPRPPSRETVIKYKVAVWKARGGVRHMKDGRIIPFKESIRHRKCLGTDKDSVPVSVLKVN